MKRALLIVMTCAGVALAAGMAFGAPATIVGTGSNTFAPPTYTQDQGDLSVLQSTGTHNVTATQSGPDGGALFRSATISSGTTPVNGTQYLTTGSYSFLCTVHGPSMSGTLNVSGAGTPQPRPQISLKLQSRKLEKVAKKGKLQVAITSTASSGEASLTAKLGKLTIARAQDLSLSAGRQSRVLKLTKQGKAKLARKSKATIVLNGTIAFGSPATAKGKLK
jgi:plastocyanin